MQPRRLVIKICRALSIVFLIVAIVIFIFRHLLVPESVRQKQPMVVDEIPKSDGGRVTDHVVDGLRTTTTGRSFGSVLTSSHTVKTSSNDHFDVGEEPEHDNPSSPITSPATRESKTTSSTTTVSAADATDIFDVLKHLRRPRRRRVVRGRWQMVENSLSIYIMSAYFDPREGGHVRVIGIADRDVSEVYCLFWNPNSTFPSAAVADLIVVGPQIAPTKNEIYEQLIFSCPTTKVGAVGDIPTNVSLVTSHNRFRPSTLLPVQVPVKPSSPSDVIEFGHCMSIMYRKHDPYRLVEWLELHRLWGVGEVNIYTTAVDNLTAAILEHYVSTGFVRHEIAPSAVDETDSNEHAILLNMSPVINDCLYRNLHRYRYVVCTDIDEMIVPAADRRYDDMLRRISKDRAHSYLFRNAYFFLDFGATSPDPWYLQTQRYMKRVNTSRFGYSSKSITRTLSCVGLQNHLCWKRVTAFEHHSSWNYDVPTTIGKNHHYKKCHFDEYHTRNGICLKMMTKGAQIDRTMNRFLNEISDRVVSKLIELDLVEPTDDDKWKQYNPVP